MAVVSEVRTLIDTVAKLILSGFTENEITISLREQGAADLDPELLIAAAQGEILTRQPDCDERLAWHLEARRNVLAEAIATHKLDQARMVLADMAKLEGLYAEDHKKSAGEDDRLAEGHPYLDDVPTVDEAYPPN
ncbi:MAG: hypothetical protein GY906_11560 [bacterium]|nr:hypothetical protein [bacterium]